MPLAKKRRLLMQSCALFLALSLSPFAARAAADGAAAAEAPHSFLLPWSGLGSNALGMFSGSRAILDLSAVAATLIIVGSGWDKDVHNYFARRPSIGNSFRPGVELGAIFPVVLGAGLFGSGLGSGSYRLASAGSAVLQASLLAVTASTALKALTGRAHPEPIVYGNNEAGETFRFGFLRAASSGAGPQAICWPTRRR